MLHASHSSLSPMIAEMMQERAQARHSGLVGLAWMLRSYFGSGADSLAATCKRCAQEREAVHQYLPFSPHYLHYQPVEGIQGLVLRTSAI